jgi:hypothetical protein
VPSIVVMQPSVNDLASPLSHLDDLLHPSPVSRQRRK